MNPEPINNETDPRVVACLEAWHENGRDSFQRNYSNLDYDRCYPKTAKNRKKYICLDCGDSGAMMVEKATGQVFGIKAYGVIHRDHPCGHIEDLTQKYQEATEANRHMRPARSVNF